MAKREGPAPKPKAVVAVAKYGDISKGRRPPFAVFESVSMEQSFRPAFTPAAAVTHSRAWCTSRARGMRYVSMRCANHVADLRSAFAAIGVDTEIEVHATTWPRWVHGLVDAITESPLLEATRSADENPVLRKVGVPVRQELSVSAIVSDRYGFPDHGYKGRKRGWRIESQLLLRPIVRTLPATSVRLATAAAINSWNSLLVRPKYRACLTLRCTRRAKPCAPPPPAAGDILHTRAFSATYEPAEASLPADEVLTSDRCLSRAATRCTTAAEESCTTGSFFSGSPNRSCIRVLGESD